MPSRLLVVSNRLPVTARSEHGVFHVESSSGGLATALRGAHRQRGGLWCGWPGDMSRATPAERGAIDEQLAAMHCAPVHLTPAEIAHYYDAFSNGVLWPLLHYQMNKVRLDAAHDWTVYRDVNRRFAEHVAARYVPGDLVWVHDYQLALVPAFLRRLLPTARIGFFLHVPFPAPEVFNILPWRKEVLEGMLASDLVSFHTEGYRRNFCQTAVQATDALHRAGELVLGHHIARTGSHPIGVDVAELDALAKSDEVAAEVARLRADARGRKIVLGVDRLDYTKGIPRRLLAIDRLLEKRPQLREKVLFIQLAVPSRQKVDAYAELRRTVNELVGRINSHHGSPTGAPLQLLYRSIPLAQLVALYQAADVMLVTPLRDGMNLVAKEYVASRVDERGVLVLSEFTGAAAEMKEAILVNPHDLAGVAAAIRTALEMPEREQRTRMLALRQSVERTDVHRWARTFLDDLEGTASPAETDEVA